MDGKGQFTYVERPGVSADDGSLGQIDPRVYGTPAMPLPPAAS